MIFFGKEDPENERLIVKRIVSFYRFCAIDWSWKASGRVDGDYTAGYVAGG